MKTKFVVIITLVLSLVITKANAKGRISILYGNGPEISLVKELPSSDEFVVQASDGKWYHADLGVSYNQFSLFYIPIWNYGDYKYVLYTKTKVGEYDYTYADLSKDDIAYLQSKFSGIPNEPSLPFWDAYGGKLLVVALVFILIAFS